MSDTATTILTAALASVLTTLFYLLAHAWWHRPRPIDPKVIERTMAGALRTATGSGGGCTGPHTDSRGLVSWCRESCTTCQGSNARPCYAPHSLPKVTPS